MKKNKIQLIIIVLLLFSNTFTIFLLTRGKDHKHPPYISDKIGLEGSKLEQAHKLEDAHFAKMKTISNQIQKKQSSLFSAINNNQVNNDSLLTEINRLEMNRNKLVINHFRAFYKICDSGEKTKLTKEINEHFSKPHRPRR
jgi:hypothetical protein